MKLSIWPVIGASLLALSSCKHEAVKDNPVSTFALSDTMMSRIQIDTVKEQAVRSELKLSGKVVPDENKVVRIFPLVSGNVETGARKPGRLRNQRPGAGYHKKR